MCKRISKYFLILCITLFAAMLSAATVLAAEPVLTITGTGLNEDILIYQNDWSKYAKVVRYYSSCNTQYYHKIWKVEGYDLVALLGGEKGSNLKSGNHKITFHASDKGKLTKSLWDLNGRYYYPHFDIKDKEAKPVAAMIGLKRAYLYEYQKLDQDGKGRPPDPAEVSWSEKSVGLDDRAPRIYFGQTKGNVSDQNQSEFLYGLVRIVVGDERAEKSEQKNGGTAQDGSNSSPKAGEKGSSPGSVAKPGGDEKTTTSADGKKNGDEQVDSKGENPPDESGGKIKSDVGVTGGDIDALEPGDDASMGIMETIAAKSGETRRRWPWIAAGAVVAVGLAGGGGYYYINKRRISK